MESENKKQFVAFFFIWYLCLSRLWGWIGSLLLQYSPLNSDGGVWVVSEQIKKNDEVKRKCVNAIYYTVCVRWIQLENKTKKSIPLTYRQNRLERFLSQESDQNNRNRMWPPPNAPNRLQEFSLSFMKKKQSFVGNSITIKQVH